MKLLETENLALKAGSKYIFQDITWQIEQGESWVLFGLNGCGKTTLLSVMSGYQKAKEGKVYLRGEALNEENCGMFREKIGLVSSSFLNRFFRREIILDMILAGKYGSLGLQGEIEDADIRRAKELLDVFGLKSKARYPYDTVSKGQQQMVLIARALMGSPDILLLDEPCSGLDILIKEKFLHLIQGLVEENHTTLLYVTHHTQEISPLITKAALMKAGKIYAQGDLAEVFSDNVLSEFLEAPAKVIWSKKHFFIDLDLPWEHQNTWVFQQKGGAEDESGQDF